MARDYTPDPVDHDNDDFDFDQEYFARTYRPLSNLPTPPPSSHNSSATQSPKTLLEDGGILDSELLGQPSSPPRQPRPPAASLALPSVPLVHKMLTRAALPLETVALAVCILDSLNSRFSLNWRLVCPLAQPQQQKQQQYEPSSPSYAVAVKRHTLPASSPIPDYSNHHQLHIDCVNPEVIILASMIIAHKFLDDCCSSISTAYYRAAWGKKMWTCAQINVTERCIMESLGYRILPLWDSRLIEDALNDMERAGRQAVVPLRGCGGNSHQRSMSSMSSGKAVFGLELQMTPVETPVSEHGEGMDCGLGLLNGFAVGPPLPLPLVVSGVTCESPHLPIKTTTTTTTTTTRGKRKMGFGEDCGGGNGVELI
ncbi:hypothetical protein B0T17DRAFT_613920 [Bombardia bombarda]|uniref:Uncharacterized protein n=1 Tax=Bombardia bombarda TaxID=252184 RepID=A0AA39XPH1_9PEZI|nr:hypothetical protein B0T17DRAFT_613920 [Bombardia bombarda]